MAKHKRPKIDWVRIERLYRAGLLSIHEIAREVGTTTESNIRAMAKKSGWTRDLSQEVRNRTRTKMVENLATIFDTSDEALNKLKNITDESIIEEAARTQVQVVREHQKTLGNGHSLTMRMLNELDATTTHRGELEEMIRSTIAPRRQAAVLNAISIGNRAAVMRDLATAARLWITLERQAFNIQDDRNKDDNAQKLDAMTADQLRAEIVEDAKKLGLELTREDMGKSMGVAPKSINGNGKMH